MTLSGAEREKGMELARKATAKQLRLGKDLRTHRVKLGLTQADVNNKTAISASQLTRIESGQSVPTSRTLTSLLATYGIHGAERDRLVTLAARADEPAWLDRFADDITERYANYISWEADAREAFCYEASLVPGLLQTDDYTRAVIVGTTPRAAPSQIDRLVQVRHHRREVFDRPEPLVFAAIIDEAVLHRVVGSPAVTAAQLTALAKESRPNVRVQVLPFGVGAHPGMLGPFCILDDKSGSPLVAIETALNNVFLDAAEEIARYVTMFEELRSQALSPEKSAAVLTAAARKIRR